MKKLRNFEWLTIFLTYGDTISPQEDAFKSKKLEVLDKDVAEKEPAKKEYNGLIASIDALVAMATIALMCSLTPLLAENQGVVGPDNRTPEIVLIVFMILGLIVMFVFANNKKAFNNRVAGRSLSSCRGLDKILMLAGLVLFYTFSFVLDLFHIIAQIDCGSVWLNCQGDVIATYVTDVFFHVVRVFYLGCATLFAIVYSRATFINNCLVRYGLVVLFGSNLAVWFDVLLHESAESMKKNGTNASDIEHLNHFTVYCYGNQTNESYAKQNVSTHALECFSTTTSFHNLLQNTVALMCYPFMYECSVLLGERFMHWFCSCSSTAKTKHRKLSKMARVQQWEVHGANDNYDVIDENYRNDVYENISGQAADFNGPPDLVMGDLSYENADDIQILPNEQEEREHEDDLSSDERSADSEDDYDEDSNDHVSYEADQDDHESTQQSTSGLRNFQWVDKNQQRRRNDSIDEYVYHDGSEFDRRQNNPSENRDLRISNHYTPANHSLHSERSDLNLIRRSSQSDQRFENLDVTIEEDVPASMLMCTMYFLATISTNVLFFVLSLLPSIFREHKTDFFNTVSGIYLKYSIVYYCLVLFVVCVGFVVARDFPLRRSRASFQGLDYLLLICSAGPFAYNILSLIVLCYNPSSSSDKDLSLGGSLVLQLSNILEVYCQIPFCFFSGRVVALNTNGTKRPSAKYFQAVLIYLSVCNATLWLVNSFATTFNGQNVYSPVNYFPDAWYIINSFALPMTLFFRFNSFLLLVKALRLAFRVPHSARSTIPTRTAICSR